MRTVIASGYRERLIGHLQNAVNALERGEDFYRFSTITERGAASDLVFEVHPEMREDRDTHVMVQSTDDLASRPAEWIAGESLR